VPLNLERFETDKKVSDPELIELLNSDLWKKEDKRKAGKEEEQKAQ
jgi:hypothetical protein